MNNVNYQPPPVCSRGSRSWLKSNESWNRVSIGVLRLRSQFLSILDNIHLYSLLINCTWRAIFTDLFKKSLRHKVTRPYRLFLSEMLINVQTDGWACVWVCMGVGGRGGEGERLAVSEAIDAYYRGSRFCKGCTKCPPDSSPFSFTISLRSASVLAATFGCEPKVW